MNRKDNIKVGIVFAIFGEILLITSFLMAIFWMIPDSWLLGGFMTALSLFGIIYMPISLKEAIKYEKKMMALEGEIESKLKELRLYEPKL